MRILDDRCHDVFEAHSNPHLRELPTCQATSMTDDLKKLDLSAIAHRQIYEQAKEARDHEISRSFLRLSTAHCWNADDEP